MTNFNSGAATGRSAVAASPWAPGVLYSLGTPVTYNGATYYCIQSHTSQPGWDPVSAPALWSAVPPATPVPGVTPVPGTSPVPTPTSIPTPSAAPTVTPVPGTATTGTLNFHLLLGTGAPAQDQAVLDGDNYTDLIESNIVAGVMYGHLIQEYTPGEQFDKDYLYGSILGQLFQENLSTESYTSSSNLIDPSPVQQSVMGTGQGGPYQINNYAADMDNGQGRGLVNYVAVQKNIGYTLAGAAAQVTLPTPPSFNNKYYGPILTAFFHYNDYVCLNLIGKGTNGWVTPWEPAYDNTIANFVTLPDSFLDILLNVAYNQGYYGGLLESYCALGPTATAATVATVNSYSYVWGNSDSYHQYPYQVHYYLDQLYGNPIPSGSATTFVNPGIHVLFPMAQLALVFSNVFQTLDYVGPAGTAVYFTATQASAAFSAGLTKAGVSPTATLDLSNPTTRAQIFAVLEAAISTLESSVGTQFNAVTLTQL